MPKRFTEVTSAQIKTTLARRFIPLGDRLRDLLTKFGLRVYRVSMVKVQWSGGVRGVGTPVVLSEELILPTPKVTDIGGLTEVLQPIGLDELGQLTVSQISGRYTEEQLMGRTPDGEDIDEDTEFFWEIEFPHTDGSPGTRRRFYPRGAPQYEAGALQWTIRLEKSNENRARSGEPQ